MAGSIKTPLNELNSEIDAYKSSPKLKIEIDEFPMEVEGLLYYLPSTISAG